MPYVNHDELVMEKNGQRYEFCLRGMRDVREKTAAVRFGEGEIKEKKLVSGGNLTVYLDGGIVSWGSTSASEPFRLAAFRQSPAEPVKIRIEDTAPAFEFPPDAAEEAERYEAWRKACFEKWETPEAKAFRREKAGVIK